MVIHGGLSQGQPDFLAGWWGVFNLCEAVIAVIETLKGELWKVVRFPGMKGQCRRWGRSVVVDLLCWGFLYFYASILLHSSFKPSVLPSVNNIHIVKIQQFFLQLALCDNHNDSHSQTHTSGFNSCDNSQPPSFDTLRSFSLNEPQSF